MKNKKYLLLGLGIGNNAVKNYFDQNNIKYIIYDDKIEEYRKDVNFNDFDIVIKSSGIKDDHYILKYAKLLNKEILTDLELFFRLTKDKKIITVTGSNGKTTTVSLVKYFLPALDLGGNIGIGLCSLIDSDNDIIIEASSFMLDYIKYFRSNINLYTNITTNHLDHHDSFVSYIKAKMKLIKNIKKNDYLIYNYDDQLLRRLFRFIECNVIRYSLSEKKEVYIQDNTIFYLNKKLINIDNFKLKGTHNLYNLLGSIAIVIAYDINIFSKIKNLANFMPISHRLEYIGRFKNAKVYNDSKSTNFFALKTALEAFKNEKILLICGGKLKEDNLNLINNNLDYLSKVIINGENKNLLEEFFKIRNIESFVFNSLDEAIEKIPYIYKDETIILFSPGSSSYDQFKNYIERGNYFKKKMTQLLELSLKA